MRILNLGCGEKVSPNPDVINIDWSIRLRVKRSRALRMLARLLVQAERVRRLDSLPDNVICHDLSRGIPFESDSVDVVYHSHFLEHLDRDAARSFLAETRRVLKADGIHRIVVPDFEGLCRTYLAHVAQCRREPAAIAQHDDAVGSVIEYLVRKEADPGSTQRPLSRLLEGLIRGDARKRGITHQWMYDGINLAALLSDVGFRNITVCSYDTSSVPGWNELGLDATADGTEYRPGSLYVEAVK